ncbi:ABC transporter ATP-binding protein [Candidatus Fermentibacterales bacterium]|nr:ABC transporter ATP-binding protein [Candidatus Fermentibacterales bacterium]
MPPDGHPIALLDDVHASYGNTHALRGLDFSIPEGSGVIGLLGRNGAGKTTAIRAILGLVRPSAGSVRVFGLDPLEGSGVRRRSSVMFAEDGLLREMTVRENLRTWAGISGIATGRVGETMELLGITPMAGRRVSELSSGNRRITALARALLQDSDLLILDEPTSSLDPARAIDVRRMIATLREGRAILVSTHNLAEAEELCDYLVILHEGRAVAEGSPEALSEEAGACVVATESRGPVLFQGKSFLPGADGLARVPLPDGWGPAKLLAELIADGVLVTEFRPARRSLAEVFLSATSDEDADGP